MAIPESILEEARRRLGQAPRQDPLVVSPPTTTPTTTVPPASLSPAPERVPEDVLARARMLAQTPSAELVQRARQQLAERASARGELLNADEALAYEGAPVETQRSLLGAYADTVVEEAPVELATGLAAAMIGGPVGVAAWTGGRGLVPFVRYLSGWVTLGGSEAALGAGSLLRAGIRGGLRAALGPSFRQAMKQAVAEGFGEGAAEAAPHTLLPQQVVERARQFIGESLSPTSELVLRGLPEAERELRQSRILWRTVEDAKRLLDRQDPEDALDLLFRDRNAKAEIKRTINVLARRGKDPRVAKQRALVWRTGGLPGVYWKGEAPLRRSIAARKAGATRRSRLIKQLTSAPPPAPGTADRDRASNIAYLGQLVTDARRTLNWIGGPARKLSRQMEEYQPRWRQKAGGWLDKLDGDVLALLRERPELRKVFVDAARTGVTVDDPALGRALRTWQEIADEIAQQAQKLGLEIRVPGTKMRVPWRPRENYYPLHTKPELFRDPAFANRFRESWVRSAMERFRLSPRRANELFNRMLRTGARPYGHLEYARLAKLPDEAYRLEPLLDLPSYVTRAAQRLAQAEMWGPGSERANGTIKQIWERYGRDAGQYAQTIFDRLLMREDSSPRVRAIVEGVMAAETISSMGQSALMNLTQPAFTALLTTVRDTVRAMSYSFRNFKDAEQWARLVGVALDVSNDSMLDIASHAAETASGRAARTFLNAVGFLPTEQWNRVVTANTARFWMPDLLKTLQRADETVLPRYYRQLARIGLGRSRIDAALKRGYWTLEDMKRASYGLVRETQFPFDPLRMPLLMTHPYLRFLFQFKSFVYRATNTIAENVVVEAAHGNLIPALRMMAIFGVTGEAAGDVLDLLRSRDPKRRQGALRLVRNMAEVSAFGLGQDVVIASMYDPNWLSAFLGGPAIGDVSRVGFATNELVRTGKLQPRTARGIARKLPVLGPSVAPIVFPSRRR